MKQLLAFVLLLLVFAAPLSAGLHDDFNALAGLRDNLAAQLQKRRAADAEKGPPEDLLLEFDEGADHDDATLLLQRRGGAWTTGHAEVIAWSRSTMQEWRAFHLGNGVSSAWQPSMRFPVDTKETVLDDGKLGAKLSIPFLLDETVDNRRPLGKPSSWWDRFIPSGHTVTRNQQFNVSAVVHDDTSLLELILEGGVCHRGKDKKTGKEWTARRPILVRLEAPGTRFTITRASTPTWNQGWHEVYAAGLDFKDGKLSGDLVVKIHQDGWVPFGGKTAQHDPWVASFNVQAELKGEEVSGTYKASGDMGEYEGVIRGTGGRAVLGRYVSSGDFGDQTGSISGMALEPEPELKTRLRELQQLPSSEPEATAAAAKQLNGLLAEYCRIAAARYACLGKSTALSLPDVQPEGDSSAYAGVVSLRKKENGTALVNGSLGGKWHTIADWKVLGPSRTWAELSPATDRVALPGQRSGFYERFRGKVWYAMADVESEKSQAFWLSGGKPPSNKPLYLKPGLYPFTVVAGPRVLQRTRAPFMARKVNTGLARPDTRLAPAFTFLTNPNLYRAQQLKRIRGSKAQLELIISDLPRTANANHAEKLLARL